ncbi:MAG: hypothetical protein HYR72_08210 [Deltaproteobacteria bacterium]|nr:hypothetical protein [Deltaproteobacteria bacterium]MBI3386692.1 hypothetical protein [Deltaproteobacteria bacterium]
MSSTKAVVALSALIFATSAIGDESSPPNDPKEIVRWAARQCGITDPSTATPEQKLCLGNKAMEATNRIEKEMWDSKRPIPTPR